MLWDVVNVESRGPGCSGVAEIPKSMADVAGSSVVHVTIAEFGPVAVAASSEITGAVLSMM